MEFFLSDQEFAVLSCFAPCEVISEVDILNKLHDKGLSYPVTDALLNALASNGLLTLHAYSYAPDHYEITDLGVSVLSKAEDVRRDHAQNQREKAIDRKIAIIGAMSGILIFLIQKIISHWEIVVAAIQALFS